MKLYFGGKIQLSTYISILNYDGWFRFRSLLSQGVSTFNNHGMWGKSQNLYEEAARQRSVILLESEFLSSIAQDFIIYA